jgi:hypothetical protein
MDIHSSDFWIKIGISTFCGSIIGFIEKRFSALREGLYAENSDAPTRKTGISTPLLESLA